MKKRTKAKLLVCCMILSMVLCMQVSAGAVRVSADVSGNGITEASFAPLRSMFPNGKYWNHVGISYDEYNNNRGKYNATCTNYPCDTSEALPGKHRHGNCADNGSYNGSCGCNSFDDAIQCMGFAYYVGYYLTGKHVESEWKTETTSLSASWMKANLQSGDYIRFGTQNNGHSAIVVNVNATGAKLLECNWATMNTGKNCIISWTDYISFADLDSRKSGGFVKRGSVSARIQITNDISTLYVNQTDGFAYEVSDNVKKTDVKWESSDTSVLEVADGGGVRGKKAGTATVTAYLTDTLGKRICETKKTVTVQDCRVSFQKSTVSLDVGKTAALSPTLTGIDNSWTKTYKSSSTSVAAVSNKGVVTAKAPGTATITLTCKGDTYGSYKATCTVRVNGTLKINKDTASIYKDCTVKLSVTSVGLSGKTTWSSLDPSVATVSLSGKVTGKKTGAATIIATKGGKKASCLVTVLKPTITLSSKGITLYKDCTQTITATVKGKSKSISWKSSDKKIAAVNSKGKITAKKKGTVTITATANGVSAACTVTVKNPTISLNNTSVSLKKGNKITLIATVAGKSKTVSWSSDKKSVATVSKSGVVTGKKAGTATIKARANGVTATCKVTVKENKKRYQLFEESLTWYQAKTACEKMGGHLVTITSAQEQATVEQLVSKGTKNFYWMGMIRDSKNRFSKWITGESIVYTHFDTQNGEPNNFKGRENVLVMYRIPNPLGGRSGALKWNDLRADGECNGEKFFGVKNSGYICEWD